MHKNDSVKCFMCRFCCVSHFFARLFSNHHSLVYSFYIYSVYENEVVSNSWAVKKNKGTTSRKLQNVGEMKATLAHNEKEEKKNQRKKISCKYLLHFPHANKRILTRRALFGERTSIVVTMFRPNDPWHCLSLVFFFMHFVFDVVSSSIVFFSFFFLPNKVDTLDCTHKCCDSSATNNASSSVSMSFCQWFVCKYFALLFSTILHSLFVSI